jgi:lipopolysaccharide/colanic/teichoic acid biosynthesis glycosyltransferase
MACNCKKKIEIEDKYGVPQEETTLEKGFRLSYRVMIFTFAILITMVVAPTIIIIALYKMIFKNSEPIVLPEFMSKYMRKK